MGRRNRNSSFNESAYLNNVTFNYYYERFKELAMSMFEWKNVPSSIDVRYLEEVLFEQGQAVFFEDEVMGKLALKNVPQGKLDVYRIPILRRAIGDNGYNKKLTNKDSVIIYNNNLHTSCVEAIRMFAIRISDLDRTIDVNAKAQKTPVLINCDENERFSLEQLYKDYEGNIPFIFGDKKLNPNSMTVLKTDAPYVSDKIYELKTQIWNEALTYLGISNTNVVKKERMISDEVIRNMGGTIASRYSRLEARRTACEQINKMFGENIEVNYREDFRGVDEDGVVFEGETGDGSMKTMVTDIRTKLKGGV
jgi:hypothetical protein